MFFAFCDDSRHVKVRLMFSLWNYTIPWTLPFMSSLAQLDHVEVRLFKVPGIFFLVLFLLSFNTHLANILHLSDLPNQKQIPYTRVNHSKYMITEKQVYIGTSNWSLSHTVIYSFLSISLFFLFVMLTSDWGIRVQVGRLFWVDSRIECRLEQWEDCPFDERDFLSRLGFSIHHQSQSYPSTPWNSHEICTIISNKHFDCVNTIEQFCQCLFHIAFFYIKKLKRMKRTIRTDTFQRESKRNDISYDGGGYSAVCWRTRS
jgi:hypothetical protein